jgi:hypothetical protein
MLITAGLPAALRARRLEVAILSSIPDPAILKRVIRRGPSLRLGRPAQCAVHTDLSETRATDYHTQMRGAASRMATTLM